MQALQLDRMFLALADRNRRHMVERLSEGAASVTQLAAPAGIGLPSAVKHLKVLEEGGIVVSKKMGRSRTYAIRPEALRVIGDWARSKEAAWNAAFDRLAVAMQDLIEEESEK